LRNIRKRPYLYTVFVIPYNESTIVMAKSNSTGIKDLKKGKDLQPIDKKDQGKLTGGKSKRPWIKSPGCGGILPQ
jgi:hypothetical protein